MADLNKVFLIGNLTRDPELRYLASGTPVASFGLAMNRTFITQSGEKKEEVCFVRVVVFGKQAEACGQYLTKGKPVFIEGRLQYRSWEAEGQKRSTLDVVADRVQFLGGWRTSESTPLASRGEQAQVENSPVAESEVTQTPDQQEDLPF